MIVYTFIDNIDFSSNTYLISNNEHCILIDCGFINDDLINRIKNHLYFDGIILTHKHFDHIKGLIDLIKIFPDVKIYSHNTNDNFMNNSFNNCSLMMYKKEIIIDKNTINLNEGNCNIGVFDIDVYYTPGHTSDSISLKISDNLFAGDTLFFDSVGRCDLPTSNFNELNKSIALLSKIINENELSIYSGHGINTKSERIKKFNMYINN